MPALFWYASCPFVLCKNFWYSYHMKQSLVHIALLVRDYDEAIEFYTKKLHFTVVADTYQPEQDKRWVLVAMPYRILCNGITKKGTGSVLNLALS